MGIRPIVNVFVVYVGLYVGVYKGFEVSYLFRKLSK